MYVDITTKLVIYVIITLLIIKGIDYFIVNTLIYRCFKKRYENRLNQESKGEIIRVKHALMLEVKRNTYLTNELHIADAKLKVIRESLKLDLEEG